MEEERQDPIETFLSKAEVNERPLGKFRGRIVLVENDAEIPGALKWLEGEKILGFDTETKPAFKKGQKHFPALLQLAGANAVILLRLNRIGLPGVIKDILSADSIIKAGVAPRRDVEELKELSFFKDLGFVDLAEMAAERGLKNGGLRALAANLLGFRVSKGSQTSNWESRSLKEAQLRYAATDAWVSRELYFALGKLKVVDEDELPAGGKKAGKRKVERKEKESSEASKACRGD